MVKDEFILNYHNSIYDSNASKRFLNQNVILQNVDMSKQGIGSGAGYIELSNGTYTVDASMN